MRLAMRTAAGILPHPPADLGGRARPLEGAHQRGWRSMMTELEGHGSGTTTAGSVAVRPGACEARRRRCPGRRPSGSRARANSTWPRPRGRVAAPPGPVVASRARRCVGPSRQARRRVGGACGREAAVVGGGEEAQRDDGADFGRSWRPRVRARFYRI
jgi:hypothetical protein